MKVKELKIYRKASYEDGDEIKGVLELEGPSGKIEVRLSAQTICAIMAVAAPEAQSVAKQNAKMVESAVIEASKTPLLGSALTVDTDDQPF